MHTLFPILLLLAGPIDPDCNAGAVDKTKEALQGTWLLVGVEFGGKNIPRSTVVGAVRTMVVRGDRWTDKLLAKLGVDVNDPNFWDGGLRLLGDMLAEAEELAGTL